MADTTPQEQLKTVLDEVRALDAAGTNDKDSNTRMAELLTKGAELRTAIEQRGKASNLEAWAHQSAGAPPVAATSVNASTVTVQSMRSAGETVVDSNDKGIRIQEHYGEGLFDKSAHQFIRTEDYAQGFRSYIRSAINGTVEPGAMRTLQEGVDGSGGFLVPEDFANFVLSRKPTPTRVQGRVTQLQTSRDALVIPKINYTTDDNYTTGMRVTWTGEVPSSSTVMRVTDPVFGQARIPIYTAMMSIPVTNDMLEDSAFPLMNYLAGKFGETVELLKDNMILNGTGIGQPAGILLNPGTADNPKIVNSGAAATYTAAGLISTAMSLPEQYDDNAAWVFNKVSSGNAIAGLLDSTGRPIWGMGVDDAGLQSGYLNRPLVGYPVVFSGFMPNIGTSINSAIFGDLQGYTLVNRIGFSVQVLRELYAETNQVLLLGRVRFGGMVTEPWRLFVTQCHT